jgi:replicative DNA helicase
MRDRYLMAKEKKDEVMGLYTGFYKLDELTWGVQPGEVLVVAGPTGGGKSVTLIAMAAYIYAGIRYCKNCNFQLFKHSSLCPACGRDMQENDSWYNIRGKNVAYISIEMPESDCLRRFVSSSLGIRSKDIQRGGLGEGDQKVYFDYLNKVETSREPGLFIVDVPRGVDVDFIDAELDRIESTNNIKLDVVIIDYMSIMTSRGSKEGVKEGDWKEQESIASEVHELARNRRIPILTAVQTTSIRSLKNETMRYGTHRVARAEGIAHNVNIIIQIEDIVEEEKKKGEQATAETLAITYHVIKNRDGPKGVIQMQKDFSKMQIYHVVEYKYEQAE